MNTQKKWLIDAHCMNMDGQAASHHVSDKLPHLRKLGIEPILLSARSGLKDNNYEHYQVFSIAPSGLKFECRHFLRNKIRNKWLCETLIFAITLLILPFYLVEKIFIHLDSQWSWCISAYIKARSLVRANKIDMIYVLGGSSSGFLAAHWLSKSSGIPWMAECFDPMVSMHWKRSRSAYKWNLWIEHLICTHAHAVVWYTSGAREEALLRNPQLENRGFVVRPGMSPPNFNGIEYKKRDKIRFCYFGGLSEERSLATFLRSLSGVISSCPQFTDLIEVHTFGGIWDDETQVVARLLPKEMVLCHGRLEYNSVLKKSGRQQVLEEMKKADFLILIHGQGQICNLYIPSKTYEYIWSKRPIFLLTPSPSEWTELLDQQEHLIIDQNKLEDIEAGLLQAIKNWHSSLLEDCTLTRPFSAEDATKTIIELSSVLQ